MDQGSGSDRRSAQDTAPENEREEQTRRRSPPASRTQQQQDRRQGGIGGFASGSERQQDGPSIGNLVRGQPSMAQSPFYATPNLQAVRDAGGAEASYYDGLWRGGNYPGDQVNSIERTNQARSARMAPVQTFGRGENSRKRARSPSHVKGQDRSPSPVLRNRSWPARSTQTSPTSPRDGLQTSGGSTQAAYQPRPTKRARYTSSDPGQHQQFPLSALQRSSLTWGPEPNTIVQRLEVVLGLLRQVTEKNLQHASIGTSLQRFQGRWDRYNFDSGDLVFIPSRQFLAKKSSIVLNHIDFARSNAASHPALVVDRRADTLTCFKITSIDMESKWSKSINSQLRALLFLKIGHKYSNWFGYEHDEQAFPPNLYLDRVSTDMRDKSWLNTERAFEIEVTFVQPYIVDTARNAPKFALSIRSLARLKDYIQSTPALRQDLGNTHGRRDTPWPQKWNLLPFGRMKWLQYLRTMRPERWDYTQWMQWLLEQGVQDPEDDRSGIFEPRL